MKKIEINNFIQLIEEAVKYQIKKGSFVIISRKIKDIANENGAEIDPKYKDSTVYFPVESSGTMIAVTPTEKMFRLESGLIIPEEIAQDLTCKSEDCTNDSWYIQLT